MPKKLVVVIMAGGLGKRMESDLPKVLHKIGGKPMLVCILNSLREFNNIFYPIYKIIVVVGKYRKVIKTTLEEYLNVNDLIFIDQLNPMGTGHALQCCKEELLKEEYDNSNTLILSGDVPLITPETMFNMVCNVNNVRIMTTILANPLGYGRIIESLSDFGSFGYEPVFHKIIEDKDCNSEEKSIKKVNCGIYTINTDLLCSYLPFLKNDNAQKEYYLTDIIQIIKDYAKVDIDMFEISRDKQYEIMGVNTKEQLKELENLLD